MGANANPQARARHTGLQGLAQGRVRYSPCADILQTGLDVVFVGTAAGDRSAREGF